MNTEQLLKRLSEHGDREALVWRESAMDYANLLEWVEECLAWLETVGIASGDVVSLEFEPSPVGVSMLIALLELGAIVVPCSLGDLARYEYAWKLAGAEYMIRVSSDQPIFMAYNQKAKHALYDQLRASGAPGVVLFTSGTTGEPKAVVHNFETLLSKFEKVGRADRTAGFLTLDHIGGLNTLLYTLANGGCFVALESRSPSEVCRVVREQRVEVLPATPTFLRLLLVSGELEQGGLADLKLVSYGSEPMGDSTLAALKASLPNVEFLQQYGMSELGVLRSRSREDGWMKLGGPEFELRVVEGLLEIKAQTAMLGYLNAPSPFTPDGWLKTGDSVEVDGEFIRVLGRRSEVLNVGGEKVHPSTIEGLVESLSGVVSATVRGVPNAIVGTMLAVGVVLNTGESLAEFRTRMRTELRGRVPSFMIPQRVELLADDVCTDRFKKRRVA